MPSTVTTYHVFTAATKARAAEVNTNFSNYRGSILPINTDTASASDLTHDLGSTEHRWVNVFGSTFNLSGNTTSGLNIDSTSTGRMVLKSGNTAAAQATENGFFITNKNFNEVVVPNTTFTSQTFATIAQITLTTDGGWLDFIFVSNGLGTGRVDAHSTSNAQPGQAGGFFRILRDNTTTGTTTTMSRSEMHVLVSLSVAAINNALRLPVGSLNSTSNDNITAGAYVYDLQMATTFANNAMSFFETRWIIKEY